MFTTEQQAYHRLRWDPRFDVRRCHVVISLRPSGTQRLPFLELDTSVVPWHRIVELWVGDELAWSRPQRIDRLDELAARAEAAGTAAVAPDAAAPAQALAGAPAPPHRFDARAQRWIESGAEPGIGPVGEPSHRPASLRVAVWNLLHDRHAIEPALDGAFEAGASLDAGAVPGASGDAASSSEHRWRDARDRLAALDADLIVLAEITPKMWELILAQPWIRQRYTAVPGPDARSLAPFGQALLSRHPIRDAAVAPLLRRSVLLATVAAGELELGVAALHLTSNRVDGAAALRDAQLAAIAGHVRAVPRDGWLLAGDFNADPEDLAAHVESLGAIDPWSALRASEPGFTFDIERNPRAAAASIRGRSARYDRILAIGPALRPTAAELFGIEPGPGGLPPSDHFGVRADLALAAPPPADRSLALANAPTSRRTALVLLPPLEAWGALQRIRCRSDRGFARWPPHVTLAHPFLDDAWLEGAARELGAIAAEAAPFELALDRVDAIDARGETIAMFPDRRSTRAVQQLREALLRPLASLHDEAREFRPHLTIARLARGEPRPRLPPQRWRVEHVAILRESEAGRFEPVHVIPLGPPAGRAAAAAAPPATTHAIAQISARIREAAGVPGVGDELTIEPFGSAVYAPEHAADLDLLVRGPTELVPRLARALGLRELDTNPPRLRGAIDGTPLDLLLIPPGPPGQPGQPGLPDDDRARALLAGPRDCALLADHLRAHGRHAAFAATWPAVRRFATARAMAANGLGWFGSFPWALLLAIPLVHDEALCTAAPGRVLPAWLRWLGALRPGARIGLDATRTDDTEPLWIAAPAPPSRNAARGLTAGTAALWFDEARRAARRVGDAATDEAALALAAIDLAAEPPPGATLVVTGTPGGEAQRGRYDRRFRGLLLDLERALGPVRPWGRFDTSPIAWQHRITVASDREPEARALVEAWLAHEFSDLDHPALT